MKIQSVSNALCKGCLLIMIYSGSFNSCLAQQSDNPSEEAFHVFNIKESSFLLPQALPPWKYSHSLSIFYVAPPVDWTLDQVKAPMFNYSAKYTLPKSLNLQGSITTLVVSNRINAGPFWNYSKNNFHMGIGYQVAFNYGFLTINGQYNSVLTGWEQQPSLTFGYNFENTAVILRGDLYYTTALFMGEGDYVISAPEDFTNGYSVTASFEQRLYKNKLMSLGLKVNYLRYHIIAWPILPVNSYRYAVPEFQIGLIF